MEISVVTKLRTMCNVFARLQMLLPAVACLSCAGCLTPQAQWERKVCEIVWVDYAPTTADPSRGRSASPESIHEDLQVLRQAGFDGLITYGASEDFCRNLVNSAKEQGFKGLIIGVWNPSSPEELSAAEMVGRDSIVLGFCVGNEGYKKRYAPEFLANAIQHLRQLTGKPVTTTEELDDYADDEQLLQMGDWVFPNVHPFWHGIYDPTQAAQWTQDQFLALQQKTNRFVWFKETGFPTSGDSDGKMTETVQDEFYERLARTSVRFAYFEAFDQPWKIHEPVEPYWGLFRPDRSPKLCAHRLHEYSTRHAGCLPP